MKIFPLLGHSYRNFYEQSKWENNQYFPRESDFPTSKVYCEIWGNSSLFLNIFIWFVQVTANHNCKSNNHASSPKVILLIQKSL